MGGGHGLFVALRALRQITDDITAVVTVADDGGSSGRIRREFDILPPGDLRMALAALAADDDQSQTWSTLFQHRLEGSGTLAGHPVGNIVLTGLLETMADPVEALDIVARFLRARGRVLPMSRVPLDLIATVESLDRDDPIKVRRIRGQSAIAGRLGRVLEIDVIPSDAAACPAAVEAVEAADVVVLGPGSWFTSVIPHLLVRGLARALSETSARIVVALNLVPQPGETAGFSSADHVSVLREYCPGLSIAAVVADDATSDLVGLGIATDEIGARLVTSALRASDSDDRHDATALAAALQTAISPPAGCPDQTW
jgi:uncharacterized cofD-like protein